MKRGNKKRLKEFLDTMRQAYIVAARTRKYSEARRIRSYVKTHAVMLGQSIAKGREAI